MKEPEFFLVGAPKCATSAMANFLNQHPDIFFTNPKEPNYFGRDLRPRLGASDLFADYIKLYKNAKPKQVAGEGSVIAMYSEAGIKEIIDRFEKPKFIVMIRNPIDAAISLHGQNLKFPDMRFREPVEDFETAWQSMTDRAQGKAIPAECLSPVSLRYDYMYSYYPHIQRLIELSSPEQVHVVVFDDLVKDVAAEYKKVCEFLGVDPNFQPKFAKVNERFYVKPSRLLNATVKFTSMNKGIKWFMKKSKLLDLMFKLHRKPLSGPKLSDECKQQLKDCFTDDVKQLSSLLSRDLTPWLD